ILGQMHIELLAHGNILKEDARRMTDLVESILKPRILPKSQWHIRRNLLLPPGSDFTYRRTLGNAANVNHCIEYYLYVGSLADQVLKAKLLLLGQMTEEIGFDQLRTKEQLGYIVFTGAKFAATTMGYRVIIQSERPAEYLEERINAFLALFSTKLEAMSDSEFESHKKSLINKRLEKVKNLNQESERFWNHIIGEYFSFVQNEVDVTNLKPLKKQDMIDFFNHYIHPTSPSRAKLSVHMIAQSSPKTTAGNVSSTEQKEKLIDLLSKYLTSVGINTDIEALTKRFESVDVAGGDQKSIIQAISTYLQSDIQVPQEQSQAVVAQGQQLLGTVLPSLGIEAKVEEEDLPPAPQKVKETVMIEDAWDFKAGLKVSEGPRAVCGLSVFEEEPEAKL
ncbi:MAG: hypothetical protein Q9183_005989, partial [Haloplaca sp. 2 TL-2023]